MARLPGFCGPSYQSQSPNVDTEDAIDFYCEKSESAGAKTPIALVQREGLETFAQVGEANVLGIESVNGRTFIAATNLYELHADASVTNWGSLGVPPTGPTQIVFNETSLLAMNNGDLFVFVLATNVLTPVNMAQFNGPVLQIGFSDGYGIATIQNSHTWQQSNLEDFTTWGGLDIATISYFPDNIVSFVVDHRELWFLSGKKSIGYYNSGAGFPVFIPIQGAFIENGAGATWATVQLDNSVFWLDQDARGGRVARRLDGYNSQRVSTHATEFAWNQYPRIDDAVAFSYEIQGHFFWIIRFPSANNGLGETWAYDAATNLWAKRGFWNSVNGSYSAYRATSHTFNFGQHLVGDWASGSIYVLDPTLSTDFGQIMRRQRTTPEISKENEWIYFREIFFDIDVGIGPNIPLLDGDGNPRPPQIMLRWSDNGGKTWSNWYLLNCGQLGEYNARAIKWQLGRARRRVFQVAVTDPVPIRFADAYIKADPSIGDRP
jgi:hypothetical protein